MQTLNEGHDTGNAALTSALIRTILESRRALRMAMAMMNELIQTGTVMDWEAVSQGGAISLPGAPKLELHQGAGALEGPGTFALKRKPSHRTPLRLVSPFRHDSPLVMPGNTRFNDAEEAPEEPRRERREEEPREPKPTESEAVG